MKEESVAHMQDLESMTRLGTGGLSASTLQSRDTER